MFFQKEESLNSEKDNQKSANNFLSDYQDLALIHTLKKDFENAAGQENVVNEKIKIEEKIEKEIKEERVSPFLVQNNQEKGFFKKSEGGKKEEKILKIEKEKEAVTKEKIEENSQKSTLGKTVILAIILFVLLAGGAGAYYFWIIKKDRDRNSSINTPENILEEIQPTEKLLIKEEKPLEIFSFDKPNYLVFRENNPEDFLQKTIQNYVQKFPLTGKEKLAEFIIVDEQNNPLDFSIFAEKIGLTIPQDWVLDFGQNFSFFLYNDQEKIRFGLIFPDLVEENRKKILTEKIQQDESNLIPYFKPLFYPELVLPAKISFQNSTYKNFSIRYFNLTANEDFSLDYIFFEKGLVISNSKMTLRSILDYLFQQISPEMK